MTQTIFISPDGAEYSTLPRTWRNATNITEAWALAHGWRRESREVPDPVPPPAHYSKYLLHRALAHASAWEVVWNAISSAGYAQYWNDAQELAEDDPLFVGALDALSAHVELPPGVTVESILEEARI